MAASIDDLEAINAYMKRQVPQTSTASTMQRDFLQWYANLGFWDKNMNTQVTYDKARSKRNAFNIENAVTPEEKQAVTNVLATGLTTEQMQGQTRPPVNTSTGAVGTQTKGQTVNAVGSGGKTLTRVLTIGVYGDDVGVWQTKMGISPPTKYFGQATADKTKAFQKVNKDRSGNPLEVDGKVGENTWLAAFPPPATAAPVSPALAPPKVGDKPVVFAPPKTVASPPAHLEGAKLTTAEQIKHKAPAGSYWHKSGSTWVIVKPTVKAPIASAPKAPVTTAPKTVAKAPIKTPTKAPVKKTPERIDVPKQKPMLAGINFKDPITMVATSAIVGGIALALIPRDKKHEKEAKKHE